MLASCAALDLLLGAAHEASDRAPDEGRSRFLMSESDFGDPTRSSAERAPHGPEGVNLPGDSPSVMEP